MKRQFVFGQHVYPSLLCSLATILLHNGHKLPFQVCVIDLKVPFLLGVAVIRKYDVILDFCSGNMRGKESQWHVKFHLIDEDVLIFPSNPRAVIQTKVELEKLHIHFYHHLSGKIPKLLK